MRGLFAIVFGQVVVFVGVVNICHLLYVVVGFPFFFFFLLVLVRAALYPRRYMLYYGVPDHRC